MPMFKNVYPFKFFSLRLDFTRNRYLNFIRFETALSFSSEIKRDHQRLWTENEEKINRNDRPHLK
jgi:hypothetical protein